MLDWLKRITTPAARDQSVENEPAPPVDEEKVERLVGRLHGPAPGPHEQASAGDSASLTVEEKVDSPADPVWTGGRVDGGPAAGDSATPAAEDQPAAEAAEQSADTDDDATPSEEKFSQLATRLANRRKSRRARAAPEVTGSEQPVPAEETAEPTTALAEPPSDVEAEAPAAEEKVERLAGRIGSRNRAAGDMKGGGRRTVIIAVASQKGGSGKTTIAAHLAVQARRAGHGPAVLIDTDPQGSLTEWWRARDDDTLALAAVKLDDLVDNVAEVRSQGAAFAIVDTPPALTASIEHVINIADFVIIPARPSPHDLRAIAATVEMVRNAGKPFMFVVNGAAPRANITAEAVAALSEHGRVAPVILFQRTDYAASMIDGRTVMEAVAGGKSAQEIAQLWKYVYAQVGVKAAA